MYLCMYVCIYVCVYVYKLIYTHIYTYQHRLTKPCTPPCGPWTAAWPQGPSAYALVAHLGLHSCVRACVWCKEHARRAPAWAPARRRRLRCAAPQNSAWGRSGLKKKSLRSNLRVASGERKYVGPLLEWVRRRTSPERLVHAYHACRAPVSSGGL